MTTPQTVRRTGRRSVGARLGRISVLRRRGRLGIGSAYREGFRRGLEEGYDRLVSMDADLSHDPQYLPGLVELTETADVAIGSRYVHGISVVNWDLKRLALSVGGNSYTRLVTGLRVRECTSGFQCFRRQVLEGIDVGQLRSNGYAFLVELKFLAHRRGFRLADAPDHLHRTPLRPVEERPRHRLSEYVDGVELASSAPVEVPRCAAA